MAIRLHKTEELHEIDEKAEFNLLAKKLSQLEELKDEIESLKTELINSNGECKKYGVKITAVVRKGSVDYKSLCESYQIDKEEIETFRKEDTSYWKVSKY